jgi:hypothetical protein
MFLSILLSAALNTAPLTDSAVIRFHQSGFGPIIGAQVSPVGHQPLRLAAGPVLGCFWLQPLNRHWALQIEFQGRITPGYRLFTTFADTLVRPVGIGISRGEINVRSVAYLELPLLLRRQGGKNSRYAWLAGVRPSINFLNRHQTDNLWSISGYNIVASTEPTEANVRQGFYRYDLGLVLGWSFALSDRLSVDVRYNQGFLDLTADNFFKSDELTLNSGLQCTLRAKL